MPSIRDEKWIWLGLGVASFVAVRAIITQLHQLHELTKSPAEESHLPQLSRETEHALDIETLQALSQSPNPTIRQVTLKIISTRLLASLPTFSLLCSRLGSPNPDTRMEALKAFEHLFQYDRQLTFATASLAIRPLITGLTHTLSVPDLPTLQDNRSRRPTVENRAIFLLCAMFPRAIPPAIQNGLIHRWLVLFPFGTTRAARVARLRQLSEYDPNETIMSHLIRQLTDHPVSSMHLRDVGMLMDPNVREPLVYRPLPHELQYTRQARTGRRGGGEGETDVEGDLNMEGGEETAGRTRRSARRRGREESEEERMVRRRRREAMVLSDGEGPLVQDDIFEREGSRV